MNSICARKGEVIYANQGAQVTVYKGVLLPGECSVAIKEQVHLSLAAANSAINEAMAQVQLAHPSICRVFSCSIEDTPSGGYKSCIVTELQPSDLYQEIETRKRTSHYWSEPELMQFLQQLVSALALAQRCGISHRDLKPQNVFVCGDTLKIGDFGSSARQLDVSHCRSTIQGSPFFLSPELKQAYVASLVAESQPLQYDPVKSDVYSLGVTLLFMATLSPPLSLTNLQTLPQATEDAISAVTWCPALQAYLRWMLQIDPAQRPCFLQLESWLSAPPPSVQSSPSLCCICQSPYMPLVPEAVTCSFACEKQRCLQCSRAIVSTQWIMQRAKQGVSMKKRCCSEACYTAIVKARTKVCVGCGGALEGECRKTAIVLSCAHAFHSKECLARYCLMETSTFAAVRHCPSCSVAISPSLTSDVLRSFQDQSSSAYSGQASSGCLQSSDTAAVQGGSGWWCSDQQRGRPTCE